MAVATTPTLAAILSRENYYHRYLYSSPHSPDDAGKIPASVPMSVTEHTPDDGNNLQSLPRFGLSYLYDDDARPNEVTVFPESDDGNLVTEWLTVGVDDAIPLEKVR